ncbi:MAG: hypothetical protein CO175_05965 [Verrucomicrobia bacterium CG_4_9_14_3_um_filter_43_20]|nr:MAG: hypothetical protein AUJ82_02345 [Verrucomicrobia bacterium CG1_02_43_26]PIP58856.1 MAG: hypothetical protein COX01_06710 [Verrucomicrobia bacterium CG22_combo_CG10-13_8_21_14_all_43_17]PIY62054.1 MAG: hypothetical protein COY94_03085 [Verrucomicrobia bacterium CG_4_10_14_0_8_um_filter_43_34]PJA43847.1 MAG: hypothetical protein CO175_05965 [Verrucomicrobia bacterium CG_4_9_14_3_um_filter_43_20]
MNFIKGIFGKGPMVSKSDDGADEIKFKRVTHGKKESGNENIDVNKKNEEFIKKDLVKREMVDINEEVNENVNENDLNEWEMVEEDFSEIDNKNYYEKSGALYKLGSFVSDNYESNPTLKKAIGDFISQCTNNKKDLIHTPYEKLQNKLSNVLADFDLNTDLEIYSQFDSIVYNTESKPSIYDDGYNQEVAIQLKDAHLRELVKHVQLYYKENDKVYLIKDCDAWRKEGFNENSSYAELQDKLTKKVKVSKFGSETAKYVSDKFASFIKEDKQKEEKNKE